MKIKYNFGGYFALIILSILSLNATIALNPPTLNTPANNATVSTFTALLRVNSVSGVSEYQIQYDTSSTFNTVNLVTLDPLTIRDFYTNELRKGKSYYWRARVLNPGDTSDWSSFRMFTVNTKMVLNTPSNASSGDMRYFSSNLWAVDLPITYLFEADVNDSFGSNERVLSSQSNRDFFDTTLFDYSKRIFWRATAVNSFGDTLDWSDTRYYDIYSTTTLNTTSSPSSTEAIITWGTSITSHIFLQVDTTLNFNSSNLFENHYAPNVTRDTLRNLLYGKRYYYRIRSENINKQSNWSITRNFTVRSGTFNQSPSNNATINNVVVNFSWGDLKDSLAHIVVSKDSEFTEILADSILAGLVFSLKDTLKLGETYYWKIRHFHSLDTSIWTSQQFKIFNAPVSLNLPANNASNLDVKVTFRFSPYNWADSYLLEIDTGKVFGNELSSLAIVTTEDFYTISNQRAKDVLLKYGSNYVWRVRAIRGDDTSLTFITRTLSTKSATTLHFPQNNFFGIGTSTNASAYGINGSSFIEWQLDTTSSFQSSILQNGIDPHVPDNFNPSIVIMTFPPDLLFETKYFWRARCISDVDTSNWSNIFNFTTTQVPWLNSPANKAVNISIKPKLEWGVQGSYTELSYQYQIATDSFLNTADIVSLPQGSSPDAFVSCNYSTTYYWRARAYHSNDTSSWSLINSFTTIGPPVIPKIKLFSPANGSINIPIFSVELIWYTISGITSYDMELASDSTFDEIILTANTTHFGVEIREMSTGKTYYWRVRANKDTFVGPWSDKWWYRTEGTSSIANIGINDNIQVYPVPASTEITVKADIPFQLEIVAMDGKKVYTDNNSATNKTINLNSISNGVYNIRIITKEYITTRKIIIHH